MRPPEFTGGNISGDVTFRAYTQYASMRPPEFTGGNARALKLVVAARKQLQ